MRTAEFSTSNQFRRVENGTRAIEDGVLLEEGGYRVRCLALDHGITSLAFRIDEPMHINVWRNRLAEMGLGVGPWLREAKAAIISGSPDDKEIEAVWSENGETRKARPTVGVLKERAITLEAGQKVAYVVDTVFTPSNADKIVSFARNVDLLFIEAAFLNEDAARAADRFHLTAAQAGEIARQAGARKLIPFHFSPRYVSEEDRLRQEAIDAFEGHISILSPG